MNTHLRMLILTNFLNNILRVKCLDMRRNKRILSIKISISFKNKILLFNLSAGTLIFFERAQRKW